MRHLDIVETLRRLDIDRIGDSDPLENDGVVRRFAPGLGDCTIIYSRCPPERVDQIIRREKSMADQGRYALEWKLYGHDRPVNLGERLLNAGFEAEPVEKFMAIAVTAETVAVFESEIAKTQYDVRRIDIGRLDDLAVTAAETGQCDPEAERRRLEVIMRSTPETMSVYLAYDHDRPVSAGRIHYPIKGSFAGLFGGRTIPSHRNRGFYTALVAARLREALTRNVPYAFVDALPTSEPILTKRGFEAATYSRPYVYRPSSLASK